MKVQNKLVILNSIFFTALFSITALVFVLLYIQFSRQSIYQQLRNAANMSAIFHLEEDELEPQIFSLIKKQFQQSVANLYYQVYDENNNIKYGYNLDTVPNSTLDEIRKEYSYPFKDDNYYSYGIFYEDNEGDFVIIAKEERKGLSQQVNTLLMLLLMGFLFGAFVITSTSKLIARRAYKPFRDIIKEANDIINHKKNDLVLVAPHTNDELEELIKTFNKLLSELQETFIIQKNFVRYVTHEFKTPLATILGNLEVFSIKDRTPQEYEALSIKLIDEVRNLNNILNTLLTISSTKVEEENYLIETFRVDELVWEIVSKVKSSYSKSTINFDIDVTEIELLNLGIRVNRTQLYMALTNLIENAVKYSNNKLVLICLRSDELKLYLTIKDQGIGIPEDQIKLVSQPFYRADNANSKSGSGIGLSIALRILEENKIKYTITSQLNIGTTVEVIF